MARDRVKVTVGVDQLGAATNGDDGNKTVGKGSQGLASAAALPIQSGRVLIVRESSQRQELTPEEETTKPFQVTVIARARQYLHHDDFGDRQALLRFDELP